METFYLITLLDKIMFHEELKKYKEADQDARHWLLVKWGVLCALTALIGVVVGQLFDLKIIMLIVSGICVVAVTFFSFMAYHNFFFNNPDPKVKYKRAKQPWE